MQLRGARGGRASLGTPIRAPRPARFVAGGAGPPALSPREAGWGRLGTPPRCEYRGPRNPRPFVSGAAVRPFPPRCGSRTGERREGLGTRSEKAGACRGGAAENGRAPPGPALGAAPRPGPDPRRQASLPEAASKPPRRREAETPVLRRACFLRREKNTPSRARVTQGTPDPGGARPGLGRPRADRTLPQRGPPAALQAYWSGLSLDAINMPTEPERWLGRLSPWPGHVGPFSEGRPLFPPRQFAAYQALLKISSHGGVFPTLNINIVNLP